VSHGHSAVAELLVKNYQNCFTQVSNCLALS